MQYQSQNEVEVWAGLECTVNRVRDQWFDQSIRNGHVKRCEDLERFASLGVKKIRYPVLWETAQGERSDGEYDFTFATERINRLRALGVDPIVGLLHHGSGPYTTSLVDPEFPEKLARYAAAVASQFPWVENYTPVNEPLTTARFSGLYGVWYPHGKDEATMLRCLVNECRGTVLAMREIRKVNPKAKLIQTDDFGRAQGTEPCLPRVEFENHRRWLTFDLLVGRINEGHPLWSWMLENGVSADELHWFINNPCPPDVIGINHYPLSNRFLDHRIELYPPGFCNMVHDPKYADLGTPQAIELYPDDPAFKFISPEDLLREVCARYDIDVAVTEVHIDGPREGQLQWINEVWSAAKKLKAEGARIKAITIWSLLGSYDWNCLCAECRWYYESGVLDIRAPEPRETAIAKMTRSLATQARFEHAVLNRAGKWRKRIKLAPPRPLLISGVGTLGRAFARVCYQRGLDYQMLNRKQMDNSVLEIVREVLAKVKPWAVINAAGYVRVDEAEVEPEKAFRDNVLGSENLAIACEQLGIPFLTFSSDLVFGGEPKIKTTPGYTENDRPSPLNVYGRTKAEMETRVQTVNPQSMIVRTSSFFGPWDSANFVVQSLKTLMAGNQVMVAGDVISSPTYVPDLVNSALDLIIDGTEGIIHLSNVGEISWADLARHAARNHHLNEELVIEQSCADLAYPAPRPSYSALASDRLRVMPSLEDALQRSKFDFARERILA